jgi:hypothetical protein
VVKVLGTQEIALDNKVLAYSFGGNVTVKYSKTTGSATRDSLPLILSVQDIADGDPRLPTPTIDRVTGDVLDPADLLATDHTRTTAWPLIAVGQRVDLTYREIKRDGSAGIIVEAYKGKEVTAEDLGGIRHPVPLDKLLMLEDDSTLEIEVKVSFDKTESAYKSLPKRIHPIKKGFDDLTTFTDNDMNGWIFESGWGIVINEGSEYYIQSRYAEHMNRLVLTKSYKNIKSGQPCVLSFDYFAMSAIFIHLFLGTNDHYRLSLPYIRTTTIGTWTNIEIKFYMGLPDTENYSVLTIAHESTILKIDNIRLRSTHNNISF